MVILDFKPVLYTLHVYGSHVFYFIQQVITIEATASRQRMRNGKVLMRESCIFVRIKSCHSAKSFSSARLMADLLFSSPFETGRLGPAA